MSPPSFTALGIDVGGTKIAAGLVTFPQCLVGPRKTIRTAPLRGSHAVLDDVEHLVRELTLEAADAAISIDAIGLGICEIVTSSGDIASSNCIHWPGTMGRDRLASFAPVIIEADVRAAARAEALFGAGQNRGSFLYISIGTGISCSLVIQGKPFLGARGATGTMASGPFPGYREIASKNVLPPLEQIASGAGLVARFNALHGNATSAQEVLAAADHGNEHAIHILDSAAKALGGSIGTLVNVLDPEAVILGGGLGSLPGRYHDRLVEFARHHIWWQGHRDLPILLAATGPDAGLIGAAASAWKHFSP
ncbi:MAG: ROK family protein [Verrucomicrobiota bacterium]|nr:ROK family protein [Verrucomicrobiota bacterium]